MPTITIDNQAIKSITSSIDFKKNILLLNRKTFLTRLKELEKKYSMTTAQFSRRFNSGEIGDKPEWFDWDFLRRAYTRINDKLTILKNIKI
jgi:hypothetical protein